MAVYSESATVIANHITWVDSDMIQALALQAGMLGRCRWFAKIQLHVVPSLGWALGNGNAYGLISFSEATRYTPQKYEETRIWCKREWAPLAKAPSVSSYEGIHHHGSTLEKAPQVKAIYDLTIAYQHRDEFHKAPDTWETLKLSNLGNGYGYKSQIHAR
ncbi:putative Phospholipid/glycerol acyltransferase domain-containing protein [Seiridium cardinale]|uniref:Phospholipid/glycerol acyltransferase domain-containing protein n=1 Tax=Seiridium cardinale TaxID=138064 RepID=A0ABR2X9Z6_9PEZI